MRWWLSEPPVTLPSRAVIVAVHGVTQLRPDAPSIHPAPLLRHAACGHVAPEREHTQRRNRMQRDYELGLILDPEVGDERARAIVERVTQTIGSNNGQVVRV